MLVKLWTRLLTAFGPAVPIEEPAETAGPLLQANENPDLDVDCPDEAFEVLRRVAEAAERDQRFVVLKKGRVPPHQRHLMASVELKR